MTWAVLFAGVIKLLIAAPTQLLLRALITPSAAKVADVMLLRTWVHHQHTIAGVFETKRGVLH